MKKLCALFIISWIMCLLIVPNASHAQDLYGLIGTGSNAGHLIRINPSTGEATLIGPTGLTLPGGFTYNPNKGRLYAIDVMGGQVSTVTTDGWTDDLSSPGTLFGPGALAYRDLDNFLYSVETDAVSPDLYRLDPTTGAVIDSVGEIGSGSIDGLAVRPSDGELFGAGTIGGNEWWLFEIKLIPPLPGGVLRWPVGQTHPHIAALAFHPTDGTLYASDGYHLLTIDPSTGDAAEIGSFGTDIGRVTGLAFKTRPPLLPPDILQWLLIAVLFILLIIWLMRRNKRKKRS